jgi:predicted DNA-binding transcriptional regulator YafY
VSRIEDATLVDLPSERPADFDLAAYWKSSTEKFREGWGRYEATLRLEPRSARSVRMWRSASPAQAAEAPDAEGWITLRVQFDDEEQACFVVLGLGPRVDVIGPASLRDRVAADVAATIARFSAPPTRGQRRSPRSRSGPTHVGRRSTS